MQDLDLILMADEDDDFIFLMRLAFQRANIPNPLIAVHNGVELIDYLQGVYDLPGRPGHATPALILMDARLHLLTGYQVLKWIRMQPRFSHLPVVVMNGSEAENQAAVLKVSGPQDYYDKPFSMDELVAFVREIHTRLLDTHRAVGAKAA